MDCQKFVINVLEDCFFVPDVTCSGSEMDVKAKTAKASSPFECEKICKETQDCTSWDYKTIRKSCMLEIGKHPNCQPESKYIFFVYFSIRCSRQQKESPKTRIFYLNVTTL